MCGTGWVLVAIPDAFHNKGERRKISKAERVNPLESFNYAAANQPGCAPDQVNLGCF